MTAPSISQYTENQTDQNGVLAATAVLNPRMVLELRSSFVRFGHHLNNGGIAGRLLGGWQLSGIYTAQSGTPIALTTSVNSMQAAYVTFARPNNNGTSPHLTTDPHARLTQWFNTSTFSAPPAFTYGTTSRTVADVRNHGINNLDGGLFKNNRFGHDGRFNLQFRAELFNTFNHVRFADPGLVFGTAQFGVISAQVNTPRQVQLALKLLF
jgi:hypothetical protein